MTFITVNGNLTDNPKRMATNDGKEFASFSVAVNDRVGGQKVATYYRCSAWGSLGTAIMNNLMKGDKVSVNGKLRVGTYTDQHGATRVSLDVTVNDIDFMVLHKWSEQQDVAPAQAPTAPAQPKRYGPQAAPAQPMPVENPSDLPF
jgi:single-strand DNA-binding protein